MSNLNGTINIPAMERSVCDTVDLDELGDKEEYASRRDMVLYVKQAFELQHIRIICVTQLAIINMYKY